MSREVILLVPSMQSKESSLCACKSMTKKFLHASIGDSNWTAIEANVVISVVRAPAHMLQLLSNSIIIVLFDALKQIESMLNVPNE